jgi:hypothetical protein
MTLIADLTIGFRLQLTTNGLRPPVPATAIAQAPIRPTLHKEVGGHGGDDEGKARLHPTHCCRRHNASQQVWPLLAVQGHKAAERDLQHRHSIHLSYLHRLTE